MNLTSGQASALRSAQARKQHRDAWLIALGVGCAIIFFGNLLGIGAWWLASLVALCMVLFGVGVEVHVDDADVPGDTKGDSIYYLGLLFTFVALVAALITFDWGTPSGDASGTTGSIRNFGIALLTTIVGLAGRVWFTMSQESPGDIVDTTRSQLEETVARMKESLDRARDDLDIMAHKFQDSSEGLAEMAETIAIGIKSTSDTYKALDLYAGHIASATQSLDHQMLRLDEACGTSAHALVALQGHAEGLGRRFDDVQGRLEGQIGRTQAQFDIVGATVERINRAAQPAAERVQATLQGVEQTDAAVSSLGKTLSGMQGSAERAKDALAGIADAVDQHEVLPLWKEAVDQLHTGTRGIGRIGELAAAMNTDFRGLRASVQTAKDGLDAVPGTARAINEELRDIASRRARELSDEMREAARVDALERALAPSDRIRRRMARMGRSLKRLARFRRNT